MTDLEPVGTPAAAAFPQAAGPDFRFALIVSVPFAAIPIVFVLRSVPIIESMFRDMGGPLPAATQLVLNMAHSGILVVALLLVEAATFAAVYRLANRHGDRYMFVAPAVYLAMSAILAAIMFLPVLNVVTLVR